MSNVQCRMSNFECGILRGLETHGSGLNYLMTQAIRVWCCVMRLKVIPR
jgi:hypothetical protein